jgi:hypothetical protein
MRRAFLPFALCFAAGAALLANGHAAPLEADACAKLKEERAGLEQAGARGNMARGPQWAKANLPPDKLDQIKRLIEVESQLLFRCSGQRLIELPASVEADPAAAAPAEDAGEGKETPKADAAPGSDRKAAEKKATAAKAPAADTKAPPKAKADAKAPAQTGTEARRAPEKAAAEPKAAAKTKPNAQPKAQPKPKAKADDAFKPPQADPNADPFAQQLK